jgi:hypothetical protein
LGSGLWRGWRRLGLWNAQLRPVSRDDRRHQFVEFANELIPRRIEREDLPLLVGQARRVCRILHDTEGIDAVNHGVAPVLPHRMARLRENLPHPRLVQLRGIPGDRNRAFRSGDPEDAWRLFQIERDLVVHLDRAERGHELELLRQRLAGGSSRGCLGRDDSVRRWYVTCTRIHGRLFTALMIDAPAAAADVPASALISASVGLLLC